jgi:prepilin-type N-terminal cleavage/methylation domain-containing protein
MPSNKKHQQGFSLLEALVAMVLTSIIALGGALSMGKIMQVQRQSNLQQIAVNELSNLLREEGQKLCTPAAARQIKINGKDFTVNVTCTPSTIKAGSTDTQIISTVLSVEGKDAYQLFGGEIKVGNTL